MAHRRASGMKATRACASRCACSGRATCVSWRAFLQNSCPVSTDGLGLVLQTVVKTHKDSWGLSTHLPAQSQVPAFLHFGQSQRQPPGKCG